MTPDDKKTRIKLLSEKLFTLSLSQIGWVESIINQFSVTHFYGIIDSDIFDECMLESFGDALLIHYEDLVADTAATMRRISGRRLGSPRNGQ
jgi:hypothetical protein